MRIGLYLDGEPAGGALQHDITMMHAFAALREWGYDIVIGCGSDRWIEYFPNWDPAFIRMTANPLARVLSKVWRSARLPMALWRGLTPHFNTPARAMLRQKCDVWVFSSSAAWSFQTPVRSLVTIHDLMHRYERRFPEAGGEYDYREQLFGNICRWATGVLVDSEMGRQQAVESYGIAPDKVFALPYIAPARTFNPSAPADFAQRCPLPPKFIFYPAQFWAHKNHANLIEAMALLRQRGLDDVQLVLVGSKQNGYAAVQQLVEARQLREQVHFLGYVLDEYMAEIYRRARAMVMPTFFGPTNIPPLEAAAVGCPMALSGIYGMPEQMGDAALYFDPASPASIADALARLWTDDALCADLVTKGRAKHAAWNQVQFNLRLKEIVQKQV
ncbi:MAG: glycosyltransferase family 4 protein [Anaerolineae bacterium]|nr:glycosyltransferase family 4 protein [Anaerolineae bacterium]